MIVQDTEQFRQGSPDPASWCCCCGGRRKKKRGEKCIHTEMLLRALGRVPATSVQRFRQPFCSGRAMSTRPVSRTSPVGWSLLGFMVGGGGLVLGWYLREKEKTKERALQGEVKTYGKPLLGGPFSLVSQDGTIVSRDELFSPEKNNFGLLYFGFTHCPDICPSEMVKLSHVVTKLDQAGAPFENRMLPLFITVDPQRDGIAQVKHYVKDFHPKTVGLTGTPKQIADTCKAFRVYHIQQEHEEDEDYLVDHSIVIYLLGPDGEFLDFFTQLIEEDEMVERIKKRVVEFSQTIK